MGVSCDAEISSSREGSGLLTALPLLIFPQEERPTGVLEGLPQNPREEVDSHAAWAGVMDMRRAVQMRFRNAGLSLQLP